MLLGIVLHAALSFLPAAWIVTDRNPVPGFGDLVSIIHGFRMPLFFVMSGFFSAMLLHRRGRRALVKHRFFRVLLPLLAGMVTIIPITIAISMVALSSPSNKPGGASSSGQVTNLWEAAEAGDLQAIERLLASGASVNGRDSQIGITPLIRAAITGRAETIELLVRHGADVNLTARDGGTPLHAAAFLGQKDAVDALLRHGAKVNAQNVRGETPLDVALVDADTTRVYAKMLQLPLNEDGLAGRKAELADELRAHGATGGTRQGIASALMEVPVFNHLWFLWFLWWLVVAMAIVSALGSRLPSLPVPSSMVLGPARYLWLIPLTMIPQWFMGSDGVSTMLGPDTSTGILPIPHVFAYYAIFFGFGAVYYGYHDSSGRVGSRWWLPVVLGLIVAYPLGRAFAEGWTGPFGTPIDPLPRRLLSTLFQASYAWLMTFGLMGMFRRFCPAENTRVRYLSDSAYWLYLAHLPLIIAAQYMVRDWPLPGLVKFAGIVTVSTALLLLSYEYCVRYTWIGRFLNGPRVRPKKALASEVLE